MEDHTCTDATLRIYSTLRPRWPGIGVALQAMLRRLRENPVVARYVMRAMFRER